MTHMRVQPDDGPPVILLPGGSRITDDETPDNLLSIVVAKLRAANRAEPAREISLAITHAEESGHWLTALDKRRAR